VFRFLEMSLHGWDLWQAIRIPLDSDVVLVIGPNGSGKTTLLDAMRQLLNAPRLSSRRRLQHYIRRPDRPALLRAVVSNNGQGGSPAPFMRERIATPEVTLACALVPGSGGSPEKRFAVLPGRPPVGDLQRLLLESRDWLGPERYARVLQNAGVSRSLMSVLAIEQGRTNSLFELGPRELFVRVLDMLGDRSVLERYRDARRRYDDTQKELLHQTAALQGKQVELQKVLREVVRLDEHEDAGRRVSELEAHLPASELQQHLKRRREMSPKLQELQTKVRKGETEQIRLEQELGRIRDEEAAAAAFLREAEKAESEADEARTEVERREAISASEVERLGEKLREAEALPAGDPRQLLAAEEGERKRAFEIESGLQALQERAAGLEARVKALEAGLGVYPDEVTRTLQGLRLRGIDARLLAESVEVTEPALAAAAEAALGDARYALAVGAENTDTALEVARRCDFPGPVYSGPLLGQPTEAGPLRVFTGAPVWVPSWIEGIDLRVDGSWSDKRGCWVASPAERVLGESGRRQSLERSREELAECEQDRRGRESELEEARLRLEAAQGARVREQKRQRLLDEASTLAGEREKLAAVRELLESARRRYAEARGIREQAGEAYLKASKTLVRKEEEVDSHVNRLAGERKGLGDLEEEMKGLVAEIERIEECISAELRRRAEQGELDGPDTVRADLERARQRLNAMGEPPPPEVREEALHLRVNVEQLEGHVLVRQREVDEAGSELAACRERYLDVISHALDDYRARVESVARVAEVEVEMQLPRLQNDDRTLDEARIHVNFGFDGKDPLPLGDPTFSGGQQVIAGIILLMGMAEIEGQGFFILDEPFAHLSLDRVDQVGRFLRRTHSQFIITAPTTLDRAQLDPASLMIGLSKKRPAEPHAPAPVVAEA
jgi:chromosome segregation protein